MTFPWTPAAVETLKQLWQEGKSASEIAVQFGVTRNTVIGKVSRMRLERSEDMARHVAIKQRAHAKELARNRWGGRKKSPHIGGDWLDAPLPDDAQEIPEQEGPEKSRFGRMDSRRYKPKPSMPRLSGPVEAGDADEAPATEPTDLPPEKPAHGLIGVLDLTSRMCRWPIGHPGQPDFTFCGEDRHGEHPYCLKHCRRAYDLRRPESRLRRAAA